MKLINKGSIVFNSRFKRLPSVEVKLSFAVFVAAALFFGMLKLFLLTFLFVTLHELCHIGAAALCGASASSVTVYPIGECAAIDGFEDIHIFKRVIILLCGPVFNIILGLCFFGSELGNINLVLGIFNLLPVYPLDGGKILHYTAAYFTGTLRSGRYITWVSCFVSICIMGAGLLQLVLYGFNISLFAVGLYIYRLNRYKFINVSYGFYCTLTRKKKRRILPVRTVVVSGRAKAKILIYRLGWDYYLNIFVKGADGQIEAVSEDSFIKYILKNGVNCPIENILLEKSA